MIIKLTNCDKVTEIDDEMYPKVVSHTYNWYLTETGYVAGYSIRRCRHIRLHWVIMKSFRNGNSIDIDHINKNKLDNRRSNLRFATRGQNNVNRIKQHGIFSSIYRGVTKLKNGKWKAAVKYNQKNRHGGIFDKEEDAALRANELYIKYFGNFAELNNPQKQLQQQAMQVLQTP